MQRAHSPVAPSLRAARNKLENQQLLLDELDRSQADNAALRSRLQRLETQYDAFVEGERELVATTERLERESEGLRAEGRAAREAALTERERVSAVALVLGSLLGLLLVLILFVVFISDSCSIFSFFFFFQFFIQICASSLWIS